MPLSIIAQSAIVCGLSVSPQYCGPSQPNLIVNGGFETGDSTGWTLDCPDGGCLVAPSIHPWPSALFLRFNPSGAPASLSQKVEMLPGLYNVSFAVFGSTFQGNPDKNYIAFDAGGQTAKFDLYPGTFYSDLYIGSPGGLVDFSVTFHGEAGGDAVGLDDLGLYLVDDGAAAKGTALSLAASQMSLRDFAGGIFNQNLGGATNGAAWRAVATQVAGPAAVRSSSLQVWGSAYASRADWDREAANWGGRGFRGGVHTRLDGAWTAGIAVQLSGGDGLSQGVFGVSASQTSAGAAALYALWSPSRQGVYGKLAVGGGLSTRDFQQSDDWGFVYEKVSVDGWQWFAAAETGYTFDLDSSTALTPFLRVEGGVAHEDGFQSIGNYNYESLFVDDAARDSLRTLAGLRANVPIGWFDAPAGLQAHIAWSHEYLDPHGVDWTVTPWSSSSVSLTNPGVALNQDALVYGASLDIAAWDQSSVFIGVDGEAGDELSSVSAQAGLRTVW